MKLSIIIAGKNLSHLTTTCIESIRKYTKGYEIIYVDDGSSEEQFTAILKLVKDDMQYLALPTSKGFVTANNEGLKKAKGDYICLLNNDTLVSEGWADKLLESFERDPSYGLIGPLTTQNDWWQSVPYLQQHRQISLEAPIYNSDTDFIWYAKEIEKLFSKRILDQFTHTISFCCVVFLRKVFEQVGYLDEIYSPFQGLGSDDNFCRQVRSLGYKIGLRLDTVIHHIGHCTFRSEHLDMYSLSKNAMALYEATKAEDNIKK